MNKRAWVVLVLLVSLALALGACASSAGTASSTTATAEQLSTTTTTAAVTTTTNSSTTQAESTTEAPTTTVLATPKFGDTVSAWGLELTLSEPAPYEDETAALIVGEGKAIQTVLVTMTNQGSEDWDYSIAFVEGQDDEGFTYPASVYVQYQGLVSGTLTPGGMVKGYVGFELPEGASLVSVTYEPMIFGLEPERVTWER